MGIGRIKDRDRLYLFFGKDKVKAVSLDNLNITKPDEIKILLSHTSSEETAN